MKILVFANRIHVLPVRASAISGHIQIPLMMAQRLREAGHEVTLVTTTPLPGRTLLPLQDESRPFRLHIVSEAARRSPRRWKSILRRSRQLLELLRLIRKERFDIVHFSGSRRVGLLLGTLSLFPLPSLTCFTAIMAPSRGRGRFARLERLLLSRIDSVQTTSEYLRRAVKEMGVPVAAAVRPGVVKDMYHTVQWAAEHERVLRRSVLFWRSATHRNGADIALEVFQRLAPQHAELDFVFAVRPGGPYEGEMRAQANQFDNVHLHVFPYSDGVTLERLLRSAACVVLPVRRLSLNPLMAILETLYAGVPLITTDVECNGELVEHGVSGMLIPPGDVERAVEAVEQLLANPQAGKEMAERAAAFASENYNYEKFYRDTLAAYQAALQNKKPR